MLLALEMDASEVNRVTTQSMKQQNVLVDQLKQEVEHIIDRLAYLQLNKLKQRKH